MPYDPYDSDDMIVLEIPTDDEEEEDDEANEDSDDFSEELFLEYTVMMGKRKRKPSAKAEAAAADNITTTSRSKKQITKTRKMEQSQSTAKSRGRPPKSENKKNIAAVSFENRKVMTPILDEDDLEDEVKPTLEELESYSAGNVIIEMDGSVDADFMSADIITEDDVILEEKVLVEDTDGSEEKVCTELPNKYLLYDELIATIIGFDGETPIVEFTSITRHELKNYEKTLPIECGVCPTIMSCKQLGAHLKMHQNPETKRYNCIYCDQNHVNRHSAASHARRHLGIRPYACDICDNYFTTKNDLKLHYQRKHLEREFICEMCGKSYAQNTFLRRHIQSHHHNVRPHQCQYCPKSYHRKGSLNEHIEAVHMGNRKPLACRFCDIEFRDSHKLARHRKEEHLNKSHFHCTTCGVEFTDIQFFNAHKRSIQCRNNRLALKTEVEELTEEIIC